MLTTLNLKINKTMEAKFVKIIKGIIDPDTLGEVDLAIYKHQNGGMFAIDVSFLEQVAEEQEDVVDCYIIPDPFGDVSDPNTLELFD